MTIETAMSFDWQPQFEKLQDGTCRATVPPLRDFEIFGTEEEVREEWREALQSHLTAYLAVGKQIPIPPPQPKVVEQVEGKTTRIRLDENLEPAA